MTLIWPSWSFVLVSCMNHFSCVGLKCLVVGHDDRVLNASLSPDCSTIATISGDETICLWKSFEVDPVKKHQRERTVQSLNSSFLRSIRWCMNVTANKLTILQFWCLFDAFLYWPTQHNFSCKRKTLNFLKEDTHKFLQQKHLAATIQNILYFSKSEMG